jgi:hypothetical protein
MPQQRQTMVDQCPLHGENIMRRFFVMGKGFETFMENPYWRDVYESAPTEELKEYYRIRFDLSWFVMGENYHDPEAEKILEKLPLAKEDIRYIQKHAGSGMAKAYYQKFIQRLSGEYEGYSVPAAAFQVEHWNPWYNADLNPKE